MADSNKTGPNLQAGAGFLAKRVQKSLNRAQEKVLQKLGKTMETKDEHFEQCFQSLNKQQMDGSRLFKDVKAYHAAVKAVHDASKRLSQTLLEVYEPDWNGVEDLSLITESEDLLWSDFEEKLNDQLVRTMENYTSQFPEVKERVSKRGRKLVDYDSARHHLEALQSAKKKDEAKVTKAEEEFNKTQSVFEEINKELREELPVLYQSRIGCYVTVFQNISNLRDVFYKEMSVLNHELYNVMKKLETQHSGKAFIVKGLNSMTGKSKKRKSLVISNPIPCNTSFPADHVSVHSSSENGKDAASTLERSISEETGLPEKRRSGLLAEERGRSLLEEERKSGLLEEEERRSLPEEERRSLPEEERRSLPEEERRRSGLPEEEERRRSGLPEESTHSSSDSELSSSSTNTPRTQSVCGEENRSTHSPEDMEAGTVTEAAMADTAELTRNQSDDCGVAVPKFPCAPADRPDPSEEDQGKAPPVPAPRISFHPTDPTTRGQTDEAALSEDHVSSDNPPGFQYKGVALQSHAASEAGQLQFEKGDIILVLADAPKEGQLKGIREESWKLHKDLEHLSGMFSENLITSVEAQ